MRVVYCHFFMLWRILAKKTLTPSKSTFPKVEKNIDNFFLLAII
jgi:hypothetical protein